MRIKIFIFTFYEVTMRFHHYYEFYLSIFPLSILLYYIINNNVDQRCLSDSHLALVSHYTTEEMWTSLPDCIGREKLR
jgi:hypothetical protein